MNLGILYPRSTAHPEIALDFMDGLKSSLKNAEIDNHIHFFIQGIGFGGAEKEVYQATEKLLMTSDIDVLVAFIDLKVLAILEPLLYSFGKLTLVINPGANYPQNWVPQPNIIFLTLHHAFLCWLSGSLAAKKNNNHAVAATTLYDCGYMHSAAMIKNFTKSGGSVTFNYINKQAYDNNFHLDELAAFLATEKKTDTLLCVFDDLPAALFYHRAGALKEADRLHLFVSPMMLQPKALEDLDSKFPFSIEGYMPWVASLDNEMNLLFTSYYLQQTKKQANIFALLGWEAGLILQYVYDKNKDNYGDGESIANALSAITISGPRGALKLDEETHYMLTPVLKCVVTHDNPSLKVESIQAINEEWLSFVDEPVEGLSSGWTNTYLCY